MTRIYAIRTGSYSDQSWGPVFSTAERAVAYKEASKDDEVSIEVHVLDDEADTGLVFPCYRLIFDKEGNVLSWQDYPAALYEPKLHQPSVWTPTPVSSGLPGRRVTWEFPTATLVVDEVYAPDLEHAVKIAADARRVFLAPGDLRGEP